MFLVTRSFTSGLLKGITITELTSVEFVVGKGYKGCLGTSDYTIINCVKQ
jgi:hypothetical protein